MDILLYLTELLQTRKTVGIVGLGTLYKKKLPGKYDADKHEFIPPTYALAFKTIVEEQEELANFISEQRNISVDSANYFISEFAERIQGELAEQKEASLQPLGKLSLSNDEINFIPSEENKVGFEFYGLPNLTEINKEEQTSLVADDHILEKIEEENKLEEENPGQETEEQIEENVLVNDEQEVYDEITEARPPEKTYHQLNDLPPVIETVEDEDKEEPIQEIAIPQQEVFVEETIEEEPKSGMPFFMKFLIAFLILVALGAVVYFINPQFFNNYFNQNFADNQKTVIKAVPKDTLATNLGSTNADSIAKNNDLVKLTTDTAATTIDSSKVTIYEVLVSAVATDRKADKIIGNLNKEGVKAKKIKLSKTMINISAGSFLTNEEALKYRDSLRVKLKNQGIYIQPIKPKTHKK
ncbi:MAG: hypothetical protein EOP00_04560 [Pedobacter sp.]|nr:MAG: hypothetical protein EOP00_04560 [Pedobacter sp.]